MTDEYATNYGRITKDLTLPQAVMSGMYYKRAQEHEACWRSFPDDYATVNKVDLLAQDYELQIPEAEKTKTVKRMKVYSYCGGFYSALWITEEQLAVFKANRGIKFDSEMILSEETKEFPL